MFLCSNIWYVNMKHKNINSAIHNFGHSFFSFNNYIDDGFVIDEFIEIHRKEHDIKVNWFTLEFQPSEFFTERIKKSIDYYVVNLKSALSSQNVELKKLTSLYFIWNANESKKYMIATDDKEKEYKVYIKDTL